MKQKENIEGNKLIAQFMKFHVTEAFGGELVWYDWDGAKPVRYHESWDWLMPVCSKIFKTCQANEESKAVKEVFIKYYTAAVNAFMLIEIETLWAVAVEFVKWYNEYSKPVGIVTV